MGITSTVKTAMKVYKGAQQLCTAIGVGLKYAHGNPEAVERMQKVASKVVSISGKGIVEAFNRAKGGIRRDRTGDR